MNIATKLGPVDSRAGTKYLYRMTPPLMGHEYVISSAVCTSFVFETTVFPADKNGVVISNDELPGSERGIADCDYAIENAGYRIQEV